MTITDHEAGKRYLMHPPGGDYSAWRDGRLEKELEVAAARRRESEAIFRSAPTPNSHGGGSAASGTETLFGAALTVIALVLLTYGSPFDSDRTSEPVIRPTAEEIAHRAREERRWLQTEARVRVVLAQSLDSFDPARDLAAIRDAGLLAPCLEENIASLVAGMRLNFTLCSRGGEIGAPLRVLVDSDRFRVEYVTIDSSIHTRMEAMALMPWALEAPSDNGQQAPARIVARQLGDATARRYVGRGCLAIAAHRTISNDSEAARFPDFGEVIAEGIFAATIACRSRGRLRVVATQNYRP